MENTTDSPRALSASETFGFRLLRCIVFGSLLAGVPGLDQSPAFKVTKFPDDVHVVKLQSCCTKAIGLRAILSLGGKFSLPVLARDLHSCVAKVLVSFPPEDYANSAYETNERTDPETQSRFILGFACAFGGGLWGLLIILRFITMDSVSWPNDKTEATAGASQESSTAARMSEGIKLESPTVSPSGLPPVPLFGPPQSPGWYWSRIIASNCDAVTLHRVEWCDHQRCLVIVSRYDDPLPIERYPAHQWYGPLTPPQWPNDCASSQPSELARSVAGRSSLQRLVRRFRAMVEVRRELAIELRDRDDIASAIPMEAKADAYESACRELERVMAGEIPAEPYEAWPESPNASGEGPPPTRPESK